MIHRQANHQIWVKQLTFVMRFLGFAESRKWPSRRRTVLCKRVCALAVRNTVIPVNIATTLVSECRNNFAQLWVHRSAVIALVIVF